MATRHTFSHEELELYFDRICLPQSRRIYNVSTLSDDDKLSFLNLLLKHHLVKVPWENLTQHYSWHQTVHLKPKLLFRKIVGNPGRGGYCMEANFFFHLILHSLGFAVHMAGSRIYSAQSNTYGGWTHVVNLVAIAGVRHLLDGGFGPQGPTTALRLNPGMVSIQISPAQVRLIHQNIPNNLDPSQKVWIYQHRYNEDSKWEPMYCFTDLEFTPADVESMNFAPSRNRHTFFTHKVVANRFTTENEINEDGLPGSPSENTLNAEIDGALTINHDILKWRRHGKKVVELPFKTDDERVAALQKYFGIVLAEEDREAIQNTSAMIGVKAMGVDD